MIEGIYQLTSSISLRMHLQSVDLLSHVRIDGEADGFEVSRGCKDFGSKIRLGVNGCWPLWRGYLRALDHQHKGSHTDRFV